MIGEADPAVVLNLDDVGAADGGPALAGHLGHVAIVDVVQFAIVAADRAFVNDEKAGQILGFALPRDKAVRGQPDVVFTCVLNGLGHREHKAVIDGYLAQKGQASGALPAQGDGAVGAKRAAFGKGPERVG